MTPTDDERREVAERLRELGKLAYSPDNTYELMADALGVDDFEGTDELFARLADLIEPESGQNRDSVQIRVQKGPECDREAVLNVAESMDSYAWLMVQLGVDTVPDVILGFVRRIREACGEVA